MNKIFFGLFVFAFTLLVVQADKCGTSHCNDELRWCSSLRDEDTCLRWKGAYITYEKKHGGKAHACCDWKLRDFTDKYLGCVEKIKIQGMKCKRDKSDKTIMKIKTKHECAKLYCKSD